MNNIPCGNCKRFDPILGPNEKRTRRGMCVPRSTYPHQEGPGQVFPSDARRVSLDEIPKPFIVRREQIVGPCTFAKRADTDPVSEKKKAQLKVTTRKGKRIA